ncbi:hypothetical protein NUU61_003174 [Penicillium alfredii]|uniref:F-box domain-containing protein n=1 Tax=Penicillium alfredii TaxID=1506179 RepID=A0A9W9KHX4_9EURO|nr:uncharacterized protein NUU61_003174 [Penicillium alfredii]KAJ5105827.1 hypothetical protein NUU61_003174 [Penicillium alfredii]
MTSFFELLPNELLDNIISFLATEPPSREKFHLPPSLELTQSPTKNLKHLAQSSSRFLELVRPQLFTHACLDLHDEPKFHSFLDRSGLGRYVTSLVVVGDDSADHPADPLWWRRILRYLDPACITVLAPPTFIGKTLGTPIMDGHSWAFGISLQILQLERDGHSHDLSALPDLESHTSLLSTRHWTSLSFNEASSLKAYNHYEYFLSHVPSVIGEWGNLVSSQSPPPADLPLLLDRLTAFSYTAVFPFYSHAHIVLAVVSIMRNLKQFNVQLAPDANNHATEAEQRGSLDPNDPWMELETAYSLIGFHINPMGVLREFCSRDFHLEAIRPELCRIMNEDLGHSGWVHDGRGVWRRG